MRNHSCMTKLPQKKKVLVMLKNYIKNSKEVHRKQLSPMCTDNTFSSYPNLKLSEQGTDGQHHSANTCTTLSPHNRKKKCLSRRYDHSLSRRLQTTWEVSLDVVSFILTAHLHGLRHVHIWKTWSFQQQSNSVSVYMLKGKQTKMLRFTSLAYSDLT